MVRNATDRATVTRRGLLPSVVEVARHPPRPVTAQSSFYFAPVGLTSTYLFSVYDRASGRYEESDLPSEDE